MPTNANAYNSRLTDEALEKRFRDTFRSQGGAELVDDLYASGVIVPVVDFTSAAEGSALRADLQNAWDSTTGSQVVGASTGSTTLISNAGFWKVDVIFCGAISLGGAVALTADIDIFDGATATPVWGLQSNVNQNSEISAVENQEFVVFLRSGDSLRATIGGLAGFCTLNVVWRQIADVSGNLNNPSGFTFS